MYGAPYDSLEASKVSDQEHRQISTSHSSSYQLNPTNSEWFFFLFFENFVDGANVVFLSFVRIWLCFLVRNLKKFINYILKAVKALRFLC